MKEFFVGIKGFDIVIIWLNIIV